MWFVLGYMDGKVTLLSTRIFLTLEAAKHYADSCSDSLDPFVVKSD